MNNAIRAAVLLGVAGAGLGASGQTVPCGNLVEVAGINSGPTPDFDQRRAELPGGGGMYCVPTSFANLMGYYALHGYPELFPNYQYYAYWLDYDAITDNIAQIGALMQCDPVGGTDRQPGFDGALAWMNAHGGPPVNFSQLSGDEVTPEAMYRLLAIGGTASFAYGRYTQDTPGVWYWHGGHSVTLNSMERVCPSQTGSVFNWLITYRDPASNEDPSDPDAQSPFATSQRLGRVVTLTFGSNAQPPNPSEVHTALEMYIDSSGTRRFIREVKALTPEFAIHKVTTIGSLFRFDPGTAFASDGQVYDFDPGASDDVAFTAQPGVALVLRSQANGGLTPVRLAAWDGISDALLAQVPLVGADALMCVGRRGEVHVFNNDQLRSFRFVGGESPAFVEVGSARPVVSAVGSIVALGFDDRHDQVLLLRSDGVVVRIGCDRTGAANGPMDSLGGVGASLSSDGRARIAQGSSAAGEDYWIGPMAPSTLGGPDTIRRFDRAGTALTLTQAEVVSPPLPPAGGPGTWTHATAISDWSTGDNNRLLLLRGSQLQELKKVILWGNATSGPWFGRTARSPLALSRSRNQMDRSEPDLAHLLNPDVASDETTDCAADIGRAGGLPGMDKRLDNNDFIAFISYFFADDPRADLGAAGGLVGHDGQFNNNDFIAFITAFFAGC